MYYRKLSRYMDETLFSCFVIMTILFLLINIEKEQLDIPLYPTPPLTIDFVYEIETVEEIIKNTYYLTKEDLKYLKFYDPEDAFLILKYSSDYNIPIVYLYRQDYIESKLGKRKISHRKDGCDLGFKQLNSEYLNYFIKKYYILDEPFDPMNNEHSIQVGCAYLKSMYHQFFNDWNLAFQAYNAGPTRVRSFNVPEISKEYARCILNGYSSDLKYIEAAARGMH